MIHWTVHKNRFQWKNTFSIRERLRKIPLMLFEGVECRSNGASPLDPLETNRFQLKSLFSVRD